MTGGGVINLVTKSGTNQFRGTAFEFLRDDALDATGWTNNRNNLPKSPLSYHQFGGTIGGPIWLPDELGPLAYNGRNRSFFFFNYEGIRYDSSRHESHASANRARTPRGLQPDGHTRVDRRVHAGDGIRPGHHASQPRGIRVHPRSVPQRDHPRSQARPGRAAGNAVLSAAESHPSRSHRARQLRQHAKYLQRQRPIHGPRRPPVHGEEPVIRALYAERPRQHRQPPQLRDRQHRRPGHVGADQKQQAHHDRRFPYLQRPCAG